MGCNINIRKSTKDHTRGQLYEGTCVCGCDVCIREPMKMRNRAWVQYEYKDTNKAVEFLTDWQCGRDKANADCSVYDISDEEAKNENVK